MVTSRPALTDPPGLVALLYRADWTRLCLSADVAARAETTHVIRTEDGRVIRWQADQEDPSPNGRDGQLRLLIAPGGRYRIEDIAPGPSGFLVVCDESRWRIFPEADRA
ncbi:MAG TPA: hypothetical protein VF951_12080, partial [Streptosporangiaceae bacterium]